MKAFDEIIQRRVQILRHVHDAVEEEKESSAFFVLSKLEYVPRLVPKKSTIQTTAPLTGNYI